MRRKIVSIVLMLVCVSFLSGCNQAKVSRTDVAIQEAGRMAAPTKPLSGYSSFMLEPMELDGVIQQDHKKVTVANDLENRLSNKINPLIGDWNVNQSAGQGTLLIKPVVHNLRIISGGARFWVGAMAGNSQIDMSLVLSDKETGEQIANPHISQVASGQGGAWSVGGTDQNLLNYIVDISYQYLVHNN